MNSVTLRRRGSWLIAEAERWQMSAVLGPVPFVATEPGRQYFYVETATEEILLVSRPSEERGMRDLRLDSVLSAKSA